MPFLEAISFTTPWALAALAALPVIWWLLRFTPPRPQTLRFPPLRILLQLVSREDQADHTPWWLMALRLLIATLLILAVAHPFYSTDRRSIAGSGPLLLVVDDGWAAAKDWQARQALIAETLALAERESRPVALATTSPTLRGGDIVPVAPQDAREAAAALEPKAFDPDRPGLLQRLEQSFGQSDNLQVLWLSDGLDHGSAQAFATGLTGLAGGRAGVEVVIPDEATIPAALVAPVIEGNRIKVRALRPARAGGEDITVEALASNGRSLADARLSFRPGAGAAEAAIELPLELRNEAQRIVLRDERAASAVYLLDDRWRRKTVALVAGSSIELAQPLLSPLYYVSRALEPFAEIYEPQTDPELAERLDAGLSMLVLADVGVLPSQRRNMIEQWVNGGGVLLRFAGPRLAGGQDDLIPVTMREGDRSLGSALSWQEPQPLQPFPDQSPFAGLPIDPQVKVARQVLAEPDADLPQRVWASLADGTPLVTARKHGNGLVILVHVTANADWSNLPLSGLFVDMLRRIVDLAPGAGGGATGGAAATEASAAFAPHRMLAGTGDLIDPTPDSRPVAAGAIDRLTPTPEHPAGLYRRGSSERAINLARQGDSLPLIGAMPAGVSLRDLTPAPALDLARWLFLAAFVLFLLDCAAALFVSGRWRQVTTTAAAVLLVLGAAGNPVSDARAQTGPSEQELQFALDNTLQTRLAYVLTGDSDIDNVSLAGLKGLGVALLQRTSVEPGEPVGVDIEKDEIVFFPLLYWPVVANAAEPSPAALAKIDTYMKNGGTILFDTREDGADFGAMTGAASPTVEALRRILAKLDIPALEPVPPDHVLTKAFYLLQNFPGRYDLGELWVERSDAQAGSGNADGVSSIMIGSNDFAAAWAIDDSGRPLYATVPGGERQRELSYRSGINIVMYALTGNYKADQVHVPALLERLGQ
ncbi:MAG: DUF4159 domain-containing protein [Rhizobiales bacterium]|nr:DUF4159 domain-containing protein [Hyphomicrobiales bacterium]